MLGACARLEEPFLRRALCGCRLWTHAELSQLHSHILLLRGIRARICTHATCQACPAGSTVQEPVPARPGQAKCSQFVSTLLQTLLNYVLVTCAGQVKAGTPGRL